MVENLQLQPAAGAFQPGTNATWKIRKLGDSVMRIKLVATARELASQLTALQAVQTAAAAPLSTYMRYSDRAACIFVKQIDIRYNSQRLQTIYPLEEQMFCEFYLDDTEKTTADYYQLGTPFRLLDVLMERPMYVGMRPVFAAPPHEVVDRVLSEDPLGHLRDHQH